MRVRAVAVWSAAALTLDLLGANPLPRLLVAVVAVNVLLACRRDDVRLGPLAVGMGVALVTATVISFLLGHTGRTVLLRLPDSLPLVGGPLTLESLLYGLDAGLGIAAAGLAVAPLIAIAEPTDLAAALPRGLRSTGAALSAALLLVPGMLRSARAVHEAQLARGAGAGRWRHLGDLAVPVVLGAVDSSVQLAEAMEARGQGGGRRVRLHEAPRRGDIAVLVAAVGSLALAVTATVAGAVPDWYPYPAPTWPQLGIPAVIAPLLLLTPILAWRHTSTSNA